MTNETETSETFKRYPAHRRAANPDEMKFLWRVLHNAFLRCDKDFATKKLGFLPHHREEFA
jgi:hypothetical protein